MKQLVMLLLAYLLQGGVILAQQNNIADIFSPDRKLSCYVQYIDGNLTGILNLDGINTEVVMLDLGLKTNYGVLGTSNDVLISKKSSEYNDVIYSEISEKKEVMDRYSETVLSFSSPKNITFNVYLRLYNEGVAIKYFVKSNSSIKISSDKTAIDLTAYSLKCYSESATESGYTEKGSRANGNSIAPLFITTSKFCVLMNEAANLALADPAKINFKNSIFSFSQSYDSNSEITTSWRYILFAANPVKLIDGKYIITSLNEKNSDDISWIKAGKTFRACIDGNTFHTDSVKNRIDFAKKMNFSYVLLDAGWYGLGYSQEHNRKSNPFTPVKELDIKEVCRYAEENGIKIIAYINKTAWDNYDNTKMLDLYQSWGIKGLKLGFMDGQTQKGLSKIYSIIRGAYNRKMIINVHDNLRPTGLERQFPNIMTMEGIKGNEHRENNGAHTTLLPFSRFMTGSGDYTICFKGYPVNTAAYKNMPTTKGHQLALSTAFFCPIQHIFWYGKPYEYPNKTEIEYFKELPTVWDDYVVLEGSPTEYFTIARKSGDRWFLSSHTYVSRNTELKLDFLDDEKNYNVTVYGDYSSNTIKQEIYENITKKSVLSFSLSTNGGVVAIIAPDNYPVTVEKEPNLEPENFQKEEDIKDEQQEQIDAEEEKEVFVGIVSEKKKGFKIYPNPAQNIIRVETMSKRVLIFDILGNKVKDIKNFDFSQDIDISNFKSGLYIISDGKQNVKFLKL